MSRLVPFDLSQPCVPWTGRLDRKGYARVGDGLMAYRVVYEREVGPLVPGLHVDHGCFNRACVAPAHLRLLTPSENASLQRSTLATHCKHGHPFDKANTYIRPEHSPGKRQCRACNLAAVIRYKSRKAAAA